MNHWVGAAVPRKEDRRMLLGRGRFTGDLTRAGMLHAAFVRSPHAHARLGGIAAAAARQAPGVLGAMSAAGGVAGLLIASAVTSNNSNLGPLDFFPLDETAASAAIAELRLAE